MTVAKPTWPPISSYHVGCLEAVSWFENSPGCCLFDRFHNRLDFLIFNPFGYFVLFVSSSFVSGD